MVYSAGQTDIPTAVVAARGSRRSCGSCCRHGGAYALIRASVRLIEWMTVPAVLARRSRCSSLTLVFGSGAGTAASMKGWLDDRRRPTRPAVRAREAHRRADAGAGARVAKRDAPKSLLELWKPALVVGIPWLLIMRSRTSARASCSSESSSRCCSGRACRGRCCCCSRARRSASSSRSAPGSGARGS